ncbi:MAG TPA: hypothetical protein VFK85_14095, partial [Anaeromyxobacteraceae bacterium]|nr:hypothetical protein [Anaeromyxobacteraceae bacterium]
LDTSCGVGCTLTSVVPVGYAGQTLFASGRMRLGRSFELEAIGGVEWRDYLEDDRAIRTVSGVSTALASMRRHDLRWFTGEALTWHVSRAVSFLARHELVVNTSNIAGASAVMGGHDGHMGAPSVLGDHGYDKQAITVGSAIRW